MYLIAHTRSLAPRAASPLFFMSEPFDRDVLRPANAASSRAVNGLDRPAFDPTNVYGLDDDELSGSGTPLRDAIIVAAASSSSGSSGVFDATLVRPPPRRHARPRMAHRRRACRRAPLAGPPRALLCSEAWRSCRCQLSCYARAWRCSCASPVGSAMATTRAHPRRGRRAAQGPRSSRADARPSLSLDLHNLDVAGDRADARAVARG